MRKFLILILLCFVAFSAFAKTVEEMDGYDWVVMSTEQKGGLIQGYYLSCSTIMFMAYETGEANGMSEEDLNNMMEEMQYKFTYSQSVGQMITLLDNYFASPANRKYVLYRTIPYLAGKEWWNRKTGSVEKTS